MDLLFNRVIEAQINQEYISNELTLAGIGLFRTLTVSAGIIIKNGVRLTNTAQVSDTDKVQLAVVSSNDPNTSVYSIVRLDGTRVGSFQIVTRGLVGITYDRRYIQSYPLEYKDSGFGSWFPEPDNFVLTFNTTDNSTQTYPVDRVQGSVGLTDDPFIYTVNFYTDSLYRIRISDMAVLQTIDVQDQPYALAYLVNPDNTTTLYCTNSGAGTISRIRYSDLTVDRTIHIGGKPLGIVGLNNKLYVADYLTDRVHVLEINGENIDQGFFNVGSRPIALELEANQVLWVSNNGGNTVTRINLADSNTIHVPCPAPTFMKLHGSYLYVSNSHLGTLSKIDLTNNQLVATLTLDSTGNIGPITVANGWLLCTDLRYNRIYKINIASFSLDTTTSVLNTPYGLGTINGQVYVACFYRGMPSRYVPIDQDPHTFLFSTKTGALRSSSNDSNEATISGINYETNATVDPLTDAQILKNNTLVGQTTTILPGDKVRLIGQASAEYDQVTSHYLTIGQTRALFDIITLEDGSSPVSFTFNQANGVEAGTIITSNTVTISGLEQDLALDITVDTGIILKNGTDVGDNTTVVNGDTLAIRVTSSAVSCEHVISTMQVDKFFNPTFTVVTASDVTLAFDPAAQEIPPVYDTAQTFNELDNALYVLDVQNLGLTQVQYDQEASPLPGSQNNTNPYLFITSYFNDLVYRLDPATNSTVHSISVVRPLCSAYAPYYSKGDTTPTRAMIGGSTGITVLDEQSHEVVIHVPTDFPVTALIGGKYLNDDIQFMAIGACFAETKLFIVYLQLGTWHVQYFNTTGHPQALAVDPILERLYVTFVGTNTVGIYNIEANNLVQAGQFNVEPVPWGIAVRDNDLWVSSAYNNTVDRYTTTGTPVSSTLVDGVPYTLAVGNNRVYVAGLYGQTVNIIDTTSNLHEETVDLGHKVFGIGLLGNNLYITGMYSDYDGQHVIPAQFYPSSFNLVDTVDAALLSTVQSNTVTVQGLTRPSTVQIPDVYAGEIFKNGQFVGTTTSVTNGDTLSFRLTTTESHYIEHELPIMFCGQTFSWKARTVADFRPKAFAFNTVLDALLYQLYMSDTLTISGITPGIVVYATFPARSVPYIDGQQMSVLPLEEPTAYSVSNGTTIALEAYASTPYGGTATHVVQIGQQQGSFRIVTMALEGVDKRRYLPHLIPITGYDHTLTYSTMYELDGPTGEYTVRHLEELDGPTGEYIARHLEELDSPTAIHTRQHLEVSDVMEYIYSTTNVITLVIEQSLYEPIKSVRHIEEFDVHVPGIMIKLRSNGQRELDPAMNPNLYGVTLRKGATRAQNFVPLLYGEHTNSSRPQGQARLWTHYSGLSQKTLLQPELERFFYAFRDTTFGKIRNERTASYELDPRLWFKQEAHEFRQIGINNLERSGLHEFRTIGALYERNGLHEFRTITALYQERAIHEFREIQALYQRSGVREYRSIPVSYERMSNANRHNIVVLYERNQKVNRSNVQHYERNSKTWRNVLVPGYIYTGDNSRLIHASDAYKPTRNTMQLDIVVIKQGMTWYNYDLYFQPHEGGYFDTAQDAIDNAVNVWGLNPNNVAAGPFNGPANYVWNRSVPVDSTTLCGLISGSGYIQGG